MKHRYTIFARWPEGMIEEVDVDAETSDQARKLGEQELKELYKPGWRIIRVMERFGMYM